MPQKNVPLPHISICSLGDPLVITSWLTNHNRDPNSFMGLVSSPGGPLLKGLILCKPDLDFRQIILRAPDPGALRGSHVAPFSRLY